MKYLSAKHLVNFLLPFEFSQIAAAARCTVSFHKTGLTNPLNRNSLGFVFYTYKPLAISRKRIMHALRSSGVPSKSTHDGTVGRLF